MKLKNKHHHQNKTNKTHPGQHLQSLCKRTEVHRNIQQYRHPEKSGLDTINCTSTHISVEFIDLVANPGSVVDILSPCPQYHWDLQLSLKKNKGAGLNDAESRLNWIKKRMEHIDILHIYRCIKLSIPGFKWKLQGVRKRERTEKWKILVREGKTGGRSWTTGWTWKIFC